MQKNIEGLTKSMQSITASFSAFKVVAVASVAIACICAVLCVGYTFYKVEEMKSQIYVLDSGATFTATARDASVSRPDEIRDQVRQFHELFFNLPPDMSMIKRNLERALAFADRSAYEYYRNLEEAQFYVRMSDSDAYQQIEIEEIQVDVQNYPFTALVKGKTWITRKSAMSQYSFMSRCNLTEVPRSPKNLHGLMISNFQVLENNLIETRSR